MVEYVPFHDIILGPVREFRLRYKEQAVLKDSDEILTAREAAHRATRKGNLDIYRAIVGRTSGFGFYHQAPAKPHTVRTCDGERAELKTMADVELFYQQLPEEEQEIIRRVGEIAQFL